MEICVNVTNPPATDGLIFTIITEYQTRTGTAGICGNLVIARRSSNSNVSN